MAGRHLTQDIRFDRIKVSQAAGSSDITSDTIDMSIDGGYRGVAFVVTFGTLTSGHVTSIRVQESADDSSWADLAGTATPVLANADSDLLQVSDIYKPQLRYIRCIVDRATQNAEVDSMLAILYDPYTKATSQPTDVADIERHLSPVAGTA